jgi:hypothetical protein
MTSEQQSVDNKAVEWLYKRMDEYRAEIHARHGDSDLFLTGLSGGIEVALAVLGLDRKGA